MTGDVAGAVAHATEAGTRADFHAAGQPGWCLGAALIAAGNPERAVTALVGAFDGPTLTDVLPADRPRAAADLVEAQLAVGDVAAAEATLAHGEAAAARVGAAAREAAGGAPLTSALARLAEAVLSRLPASVARPSRHSSPRTPRSTDSAHYDDATRPLASCAVLATVFGARPARHRGPSGAVDPARARDRRAR